MLSWKDVTMLSKVGGAANGFEHFKKTRSTNGVEGFREINERDKEGHPLFTALFLELAE